MITYRILLIGKPTICEIQTLIIDLKLPNTFVFDAAGVQEVLRLCKKEANIAYDTIDVAAWSKYDI